MNDQKLQEIFDGTVNDFIAVHFKGMKYESVISFVEAMLLRLKEDSNTLTTVKDIYGN